MNGTKIKGGEGYLVGDRLTAETLFLTFLQEGFRGLYLFSGSPHFSFGDVYFIRLDGCSLNTVARKVQNLFSEKRSIVFIEGILPGTNSSRDVLSFLSLLKDKAFFADSSIILFLDREAVGDGHVRLLLEKEFMKV